MIAAGTTPEVPRLTGTQPGQYPQITGGGRRLVAGGHGATWFARFFGVVSRPGAALVPVVTQGGVVNGASFASTPLVAPGGLITIFGSTLADAPTLPNSTPSRFSRA